MKKHEVVLRIEKTDELTRYGNPARRLRGPEQGHDLVLVENCTAWFGTDTPGTRIRVTVEEIGPTWPVVRAGKGYGWSGCCGAALGYGPIEGACPACGATLKGETSHSHVAGLLKQEG